MKMPFHHSVLIMLIPSLTLGCEPGKYAGQGNPCRTLGDQYAANAACSESADTVTATCNLTRDQASDMGCRNEFDEYYNCWSEWISTDPDALDLTCSKNSWGSKYSGSDGDSCHNEEGRLEDCEE